MEKRFIFLKYHFIRRSTIDYAWNIGKKISADAATTNLLIQSVCLTSGVSSQPGIPKYPVFQETVRKRTVRTFQFHHCVETNRKIWITEKNMDLRNLVCYIGAPSLGASTERASWERFELRANVFPVQTETNIYYVANSFQIWKDL